MSTISSRVSQQSHQTLRQKSTSTSGPTLRSHVTNASSTRDAPKSGNNGAATFFSLMASKRLARQFASRVRAKRRAPSESVATTVQVTYEPTYRMEPQKKFEPEKVKNIVQSMVDSHMNGFTYSPQIAATLSKVLTSEIKDAIRALDYPRYKIVCLVTIGQKLQQGMRMSSLCSWDPAVDTYASYQWNDNKAFCCAMVYGIYHE